MALRRVLVTVLLCAGCAAPAPADVTGSWTGRLDLPGGPLDLGITLAGTPEARTGTLDVPAQGIAGMPLAGVTVDGATVRFTVPGLPGDASFAGTLIRRGAAASHEVRGGRVVEGSDTAADGATIDGSFT